MDFFVCLMGPSPTSERNLQFFVFWCFLMFLTVQVPGREWKLYNLFVYWGLDFLGAK